MAPETIHRGDIFWIKAEPGPAHPHVVVQDDVFNRSRISTVVVCALTSNLHKVSEPGNVLLEEGEGNLPEQSVVVVSQIDDAVNRLLRKGLERPAQIRRSRRGFPVVRGSRPFGSEDVARVDDEG